MKGFCELLFWVSTRALGSIRYLTINTRSNRVAIISSVITRIFFFNSAIPDGHISTYFNKDTRDLYVVHSAHVPVISCSILLLLFDFHSILLFDSFAFYCSLFIFQRKRFSSDPGLYSKYFDPVVREEPVHHRLCKSNKHHTLDCTVFVLV
jgi:hypothetical protein